MAQVTRTGIKSTAIQSPTDEATNHTLVLRQLKECIEIAQRLRGDVGDSYVRVSELVDAGLVRLVGGTVQPPSTDAPPGGSVPDSRQVNTDASLTGGGALTADLTLSLVNDDDTPGNDKYYGTDSGGTKGFFDLPTGGGGSSPLTTKGDIWGYNSTDDRVPVGTDGDVLTADSSDPLGVSWQTPSVGSSANVTPDTHPTSPNLADDEFEGAALDTAGTRVPGATAWTWRNQGTATATLQQGAIQLKALAAAGDNLKIIEQALPGVSRYRARIATDARANFSVAGICLINSGSGKVMTLGPGANTGNVHTVYKFTNATTFSAAAYNTLDTSLFGATTLFKYVEVEYDGTNVIFRISGSGVNGSFVTVFTEAAATFLGTPDKVGLFASSNNASNSCVLLADWFRRMA